MIDSKVFSEMVMQAQDELLAGHLRSGHNLMSAMLASVNDVQMVQQLQQLSDDYSRLLDFAIKNSEDATRQQQYDRVLHKSLSLLQDIARQRRIQTSNDTYTRILQSYAIQPDDSFLDVMHRWQDNTPCSRQDAFFDLLWTAPQLNNEQEQQVRLILCELTEEGRAQAIGALIMAILEYFDPAKMRILAEYSDESFPAREQARALVGIALCNHVHSRLMALYPQLQKTIQKSLTAKYLTQIQHDICNAIFSAQIQQKLHDEIMPQFMQWGIERHKMGFDEEEDFNPVDAFLDNLAPKERKEVAENLREMHDMIADGVDMNLSSVGMLKMFSFFRRPCHWLAPYEKARPESTNIPLVDKAHMCDSDKYSFALVLNKASKAAGKEPGEIPATLEINAETMESLPEGQPHIIRIEGFPQDIEGIEDMNQLQAPNDLPSFIRYAIQDLYRLFHLSPWNKEFINLFDNALLLTNSNPQVSQDSQYLQDIAHLLYRHKRYADALQHLQLLAKAEGSCKETLMLIGGCYKNLEQLPQAIAYLRQAEMLSEPDPNLLWELQLCLGMNKQHAEQYEVLLQLEELQPESSRVTSEMGLCLIEQKQWEEAKKRFYKLEFCGKKVTASQRAIAWCSLQLHDFANAEKYYLRIANEQPEQVRWEDYLNMGHTLWAVQRTEEALTYYTDAIKRYVSGSPDKSNALAPFDEDIPMLIALGKSEMDCRLMHDMVADRI